MSKFKGTQGNWKIYDSDDDSLTITNSSEQQAIAFLPELYEKTKANALLISKAPELLDMLERILKINKCHDFYGHLINDDIEELIKQSTTL